MSLHLLARGTQKDREVVSMKLMLLGFSRILLRAVLLPVLLRTGPAAE